MELSKSKVLTGKRIRLGGCPKNRNRRKAAGLYADRQIIGYLYGEGIKGQDELAKARP